MMRPTLLALLTALAACSAPEAVWVPPTSAVLPGGTGSAWVFDANGGAGDGLAPIEKPPGAGALRASAKDQSRGYAAVLYGAETLKRERRVDLPRPNSVVVLDLENGTADWHTLDLPDGRASVALGAGGLGVLARATAVVLGVPGGEERARYDLDRWLAAFGLDRADLFVPLGEDRFALVASRVPSAFQDGRVVCQAIDASLGDFELLRGEGDVPALGRLGAATAVADTVYLAGIRERVAQGALTSTGTMHQSVEIVRVDLDSGRARLVIEEHQLDRDARILDLAAGRDPVTGLDLVATLSGASGEVRVYDVDAEGIASAPRHRRTLPGASSLAWVAPDRIAVGLDGGAVEFIEIRR